MKFIGRGLEINLLNNAYESDKKEFVLIHGVYRIGKTTLIKEFIKDKKAIYFHALALDPLDNLREINKRLFNDENKCTSFKEVFIELTNLIKKEKEKVIFIIDEFYLIETSSKEFKNDLYDFFKKYDAKNLLLIIGISNMTLAKDLFLKEGSIFNSLLTEEIRIKPLRFKYAINSLKEFSDEDKLKYLVLCGTYAGDLALLNKDLSFKENLKELFYKKYAIGLDKSFYFEGSGIRTFNLYNSILRAIALGNVTPIEISNYINIPLKTITKYLVVLSNEGIIKKNLINFYHRSAIYFIARPFLDFYYKFIFEHVHEIKEGLGEEIFNNDYLKIEEYLNRRIGKMIADLLICKSRDDIVSFPYIVAETFNKNKDHKNSSIDVIGLFQRNIIFCNCLDFSKEKDKFDLLNLIRDSNVRAFSGYNKKSYLLFSTIGFSDNLKELESNNIKLINYKDLINEYIFD